MPQPSSFRRRQRIGFERLALVAAFSVLACCPGELSASGCGQADEASPAARSEADPEQQGLRPPPSQAAVAAQPDGTQSHRFVSVPQDISTDQILFLIQIARRGELSAVDPVLVPGSGSQAGTSEPARFIRLTGTKEERNRAEKWLSTALFSEQQLLEREQEELASKTVTMDFPGGTIEEFLSLGLGKFNLPAPVFQSEQIRTLRMRPVRVELMSVSSFLRLLKALPPATESGETVGLTTTFVGDGGDPSNHPTKKQVEQYRRGVLIIGAAKSMTSDGVPTRRAAFLLSDGPIDAKTLDVTLEAMAIATSMDGPSSTFKVQFHPPSGLLIVRGAPEEIAVAAQIVKGKFPGARIDLPSETSLTPATPAPSAAAPQGASNSHRAR